MLAIHKFKSRPSAYLLIPVIAAFVGWFTNYLAVQMIFYPIQFRGIPIWRKKDIPLGLIGWQGIGTYNRLLFVYVILFRSPSIDFLPSWNKSSMQNSCNVRSNGQHGDNTTLEHRRSL